MKYELKTNKNVAYTCHYHVCRPKYRRKVLVSPIDERLKTIILETIEKWGQEFIEMEVDNETGIQIPALPNQETRTKALLDTLTVQGVI